MKYRMNRVTYWTLLVAIIATYAVLLSFMDRPPGAELPLALIAIPRLHDIGKSGWWIVVGLAAEILIIAGAFWVTNDIEGIMVAGGVAVIVILGLMAILGSVQGIDAPNRWGPAPAAGIKLRVPKS